MADTTQTQASAPKNAEKFKVYYYSDMSMTDERYHHLPILAPLDLDQAILDGKLWHITAMVPPKDMVDPVLDPNANGGIGAWVENDKNGQAQKLADMQTKADSLTIANAKLDSALKTVQQAQVASTTQSQMETKQMGQIMQVLQTMQQSMATLAKSVTAQPTAPKQDSQATQASDAKNGGNK